MDALTLHQPYATLVILGLKPWETRGEAPPAKVIGARVGIHAGLSDDSFKELRKPELRDVWRHIRELLTRAGVDPDDLPRGKMLGTARIAGAWRVKAYSEIAHFATVGAGVAGSMPAAAALRPASPTGTYTADTDLLGNYGPGRWIIRMSEVERFATPPAARGYQGWWPWREQEALL